MMNRINFVPFADYILILFLCTKFANGFNSYPISRVHVLEGNQNVFQNKHSGCYGSTLLSHTRQIRCHGFTCYGMNEDSNEISNDILNITSDNKRFPTLQTNISVPERVSWKKAPARVFSVLTNMASSRLKTISLIIRLLILKLENKFLKRILNKDKNPKSSKFNNPKPPGKLQLIIIRLLLILSRPAVLMRLILGGVVFIGLDFYAKYIKSLTLELPYSYFLQVVSDHPESISALRLTPDLFSFTINGKAAITRPVPVDLRLINLFQRQGLTFYTPPVPSSVISGLLSLVLYLGFWWVMTTRMNQGPGDPTVGKSKEQLALDASLSFEDVAGQDSAKRDVMEVVDMLRRPETYRAVGARIPSGILLSGPPGTGKTLLARVTAAEAGVPFYSVSASEFVEVFVGRGAARVRQLFKKAAQTGKEDWKIRQTQNRAPCIVFIDELDSIGRSRRLGSMNSEQETTLNQLLTCMDGLDTNNNGVIVMAATNRVELLDSALLRSGRFDRSIQCPLPDKSGRLAVLRVHAKRLNLGPDVDLDRIARLTPGTCGADMATIVNEAAIRTARRKGDSVSAADFEDALRSFLSGRGLSLASLTEAGISSFPPISNWMKGLGGEPNTGAAF